MSLHSRPPRRRWLGFVSALWLSSLAAGCSVGTGPNVPDGPTWSLAEKKQTVPADKLGERNALGVQTQPSQPVTPAPLMIEVRKGDTLHGLALQHRISVKALMAANSLTTHTIRPGQKLSVPKATN